VWTRRNITRGHAVVRSVTWWRIRLAFWITCPVRHLRTRAKPSVLTRYHGTHCDRNWTKTPWNGTTSLRSRGRCSSHTHWTGCFPHQRKSYIILWKEVSLLISPHRRLTVFSVSRGARVHHSTQSALAAGATQGQLVSAPRERSSLWMINRNAWLLSNALGWMNTYDSRI
jgi:hypothetical protein